MLRKFEILAPAKNLEYGIQAIKCGADSVYIACDKFGLRRIYSNTIEDIKKLVLFAHRYWVRVYVTLNSIIYKEEDLKYIKKTIVSLYKIGVDAIIINDTGILTYKLPPIPIFIGVNSRCLKSDKINFLHKIGATRIILPRELSLKEIKNIRKETTIPLEVFIHGTMCFVYTGNCYLKYAQTIKNTHSQKKLIEYQKASSNAGFCSANCAHMYNLLDAEGNYIVKQEPLLNMRYLNLVHKMEDFFKIGITSFKIEGRQRELSYLKNIVALANNKANEILKTNKNFGKRISSGKTEIKFTPSLNKTFNRGFTEYFFNGRKPENSDSKAIYGTFIGKVKYKRKNILHIETKFNLNIGDRLLCSLKNNKTQIVNIVNIKGNKYYIDNDNAKIKGWNLYRIINAKEIEKIEKAPVYRYIETKIKISENDKKNYKISIIDEDNIKASVIYKKQSQSKIKKENLFAFFNKNKEYEFKVTEIITDNNVNIKDNDLKHIQEILYMKLRTEREKYRPKEKGKINNTKLIKYPQTNITALDNVTNKKAIEFYKKHGVKNIEPAIESSLDISNKPIAHGKYCIKYEQGYCSKKKGIVIPKEPWFLEDKFGNKYKLKFNCDKCEMDILG